MLLKVLVSEASLLARRAALSPMRWPAIPNHPSTEIPFYIIVSPKHASHYRFENERFATKKKGRASAFLLETPSLSPN